MEVLQFFVTVVTLVAVFPVAFYCLEVLAGCLRRRPRRTGSSRQRPSVAVLVPAHNESAGIAATIRSIQGQLGPGDLLVVVADNCNDDTAEVARKLGVTVYERHDTLRLGKGFALAFGLDRLADDPPDVVLFFDADCRLGPGTVEHLAVAAATRQRPVQALYLCQATADGGPQQMISSLAFRFRNLIRTTGLSRLGGPCHLTGSGMALPWKLVDRVPWASGNVVEDMQLGIDFAMAGLPPVFLPEATVTSDLPSTDRGILTQRRRWEHGFLETALSQTPQMLSQAVESRSWSLLLLACDLMVPPLALLTLGLMAGWLLALLGWLVGLGIGSLLVITAAGFAFAGATLLGWAVHCRDLTPLSIFSRVPLYLLAKLPLYAGFLTRRERRWVRAER